MGKRLKRYTGYFKNFGYINGSRIMIAGWCSHFAGKYYSFSIFSEKIMQKVWLRINTTDILIAQQLLCDNGSYDFLYSLAEIENVKTVIDAGANIGLFSTIIHSMAPSAKIIAIEPDSGNCEMLRKNMDNITSKRIYNAGLWNKDCKLSVCRERNAGELGFTVFEDDQGDVDAISIERILKDNNISSVDILKIDIEGSELEVFDDTIDHWIDKVSMIIIETHDRIKTGCSELVDKQLSKRGFIHGNYSENEIYYHPQRCRFNVESLNQDGFRKMQ